MAKELLARGAEVILISGPVSLDLKHEKLTRIDVVSAEDMYNAAIRNFENVDVAIMSAAVADFTPEHVALQKQKSNDVGMKIKLKPTKDIAQKLGEMKKDGQKLIGFALETDNEEANAEGKIQKKNFDFIVLNSLNDKGAGFRHDTNKITIIKNTGEKRAFDLKTKRQVAKDIIDTLAEEMAIR